VVKLENKHWPDRVPKVVVTNDEFKEPTWNKQMYTDRNLIL
jgi:hypothetical protein